MKSLKQLATTTAATNVRLWGKIHGSETDYYIAEGVFDGNQIEEPPADFEARGSGVNKFVYWACNNPLTQWTQLPDLLPKDIKAARSIKVNFSGNLERTITTNPFFFGKEKHFLRAQVARISHSTTLAPKGLYRTVEDNERDIEDNTPEDGPIKLPSTQDMAKPESWVHYSQNILLCNRLTHMEPEADENEDPEVLKKRIEAADPFERRLKPINLDAKVKGGLPAWTVKLCGDSQSFQNSNPALGQVNYGVVVVKSLQWPGSYSFYT